MFWQYILDQRIYIANMHLRLMHCDAYFIPVCCYMALFRSLFFLVQFFFFSPAMVWEHVDLSEIIFFGVVFPLLSE